jgi:3-oxoacyl-[acyl-carrier-protein] synthase III
MIGIQAIGTYLPTGRIDNLGRAAQFAVDESFLREKSGMVRLAIREPHEETSDLCSKAFTDLQQKADLRPEDVDCIVVCTQNPDGRGLPHTSASVHAALGLPDSCAAFDISLGCSGFVYGLSVIQSFMESNTFRRGILFTADPYSKIIDSQDKSTSLLFGDGAAATLISDTPLWRTGKFVFGSHGQSRDAIHVDSESGKLSINGRAVFTFSATVVPDNINAMLAANGLSLNEIDYFALHQGSRYIVDTIRKRLGIAEDRAPFVAADYGNTVCSSIPIMLSKANVKLRHIVIAGFGVGLSWASSVLYRVGQGVEE